MTLVLTIIFLVAMIAIFYKHHLNFFTVLACNTCISTVIFVSNALAIVVYMMIWDQSVIKIKTDFLCTVRGYIDYISIACIYHSYLLQALYHYWCVNRITRFDSTYFRLFFIITQWIIDIIIPLPILLHGDLNEVSSGSVCAMSMFSIWLVVYACGVIYFSSLGIIFILYRQVIIHAKQSGAAITRQLNSNRDVVVVRRIAQIMVALIFCGLPFMMFFLMSLINPSSLPDYYLHLVDISIFLSIFAQMIFLIVYTPDIKTCLIELRNKYFTQHNRIIPFPQYTNQTQ